MKKVALFYLLLTLLLMFSCTKTITKQHAKKTLQELFAIKISDNFTLTQVDQDAAMGADFTEVFIAKFTAEEFHSIFKKVNPRKIKIIDADLYGYTIEQNNERRSAIFDPQYYTIKYTYNSE